MSLLTVSLAVLGQLTSAAQDWAWTWVCILIPFSEASRLHLGIASVHAPLGQVQKVRGFEYRIGHPLRQLSSPGTLFGSQGPSSLTLWLEIQCFCQLPPPVLSLSSALPGARWAKERKEKRQGELPHTLLTTGPLSSAPLA